MNNKMGIFHSGVEAPQPNSDRHMDMDERKSDMTNRNPSHEIESWEKTYREWFTRRIITSQTSYASLLDLLYKPDVRHTSLESLVGNDNPHCQCTPRYAGPTPEPISEELEVRMRQELVRSYHRIMEYRSIRARVRESWLPKWHAGCAHVPCLSHGDTLPPGLLEEDLLSKSWLKQTAAVYFEPEFMRCFAGKRWDDARDEMEAFFCAGCAYIARALLAAWLEVHHNDGQTPNFQQMRYFAKPIILDRKPGQNRATGDTIYTHKIICEQLQHVQNRPISSRDPYTWVEHGCEMGPIYRSVIIIVDKQLALRRGEDEAEQHNILFKQCSVLLVRTGDEDHLIEPIDLSVLVNAGLTLPLGRSEAALVDLGRRQQIVRVRLRTAVRFIMDLERRERNASARLTAMETILDMETFCEADMWAEKVLSYAKNNGTIDWDITTWRAVRLAQAHLDGDRCGLEDDQPFEERHILRRP